MIGKGFRALADFHAVEFLGEAGKAAHRIFARLHFQRVAGEHIINLHEQGFGGFGLIHNRVFARGC